MIGYIIGCAVLLTVGGYFTLGVSMMGLPHKCKLHGWCSSAICFECDDELEKKTEKN